MFTLQTLAAESDGPRREMAESSGFSLHAGIAAKAAQREKLEQLARYVARPPRGHRAAVADRGRAGALCIEDAVSRPHHARDLRGEASATDRQRALTWAQRLKRVFAIDIEVCRSCGGRLRVIASIEDPAVIERILEHLGRDDESVDPAHPSRAPPPGDRLF